MNDRLNIETILGYVANDNPLRASRDGKLFEGMIPAPAWTEVVALRNGSVTDTVHEMQKIIEHYHWQAAKVAKYLKGKTLYETCHNIWDWLFYHIKYKEDAPKKEELRTFSRIFAERKTGIDCDDFSIGCGCLLRCLNIPFYIRIARYEGKDYFQHVYVVVPISKHQYITIDGVLDKYDAEKTPVETKDFLIMNTSNLNGIDISVLGAVEDNAYNEMSGIISGIDFKEVNDLEGLGTVASEEQELGAIKNYLMRTRRFVNRHPNMIKEVEHPQSFLGMLDYALKYWDSPNRENALTVLEGEENRHNELEGLGGVFEGHEDVDLFYGLNNLGSFDVLGKVKRQKKFFAKVKQAVKKAGTGIKKIARGIIRFNPATASIRATVLLALKTNVLKVASKLKFGYLTEDEAKSKGFDLNEWRKLKEQVKKAEGMFVKILAGKAENFKKAILSGRAGGLNGYDPSDYEPQGVNGLGVYATAAAASTAATAVPFLTKILNLLKKINFQKLGAGIQTASKLFKRKHKADKDEPTEEGGSAMPEGGEAADPPSSSESSDPVPSENEKSSNDNTTSDNSDAETVSDGSNIRTPESSGNTPTANTNTNTNDTNSQEENKPDEDENKNPNNLPEKNNARDNTPITPVQEVSIFTKAVDWVQKNKGMTALIASVGAGLILYGMFKPKQHALSGVRRGRQRKGKNKKNPPKTVSNVGKKKSKSRKGKGGKFKL